MTTEQRLAAILRQHFGPSRVDDVAACSCGWKGDGQKGWSAHVAVAMRRQGVTFEERTPAGV